MQTAVMALKLAADGVQIVLGRRRAALCFKLANRFIEEHGLRKQIALRHIALKVAEGLQHVWGLHAFSHSFDAKGAGHLNDAVRDGSGTPRP